MTNITVEATESEIANMKFVKEMKFVRENSTIKVPEVYVYNFDMGIILWWSM